MGELIGDGGIWAIVILIVGISAVLMRIAVLIKGDQHSFSRLARSLTNITLLCGVCGTAMGLSLAGDAISASEGAMGLDVLAGAIGISMSPLVLASGLAAVSEMLHCTSHLSR